MSSIAKNPKAQMTVLALVVASLMVSGVLAVYFATAWEAAKAGNLVSGEAVKQLLLALVGACVAYSVYRFVPVRVWTGRIVWAAWAVAIVLLILTALIGQEEYGAVRRIEIGSFQIQGSEFVKVALALMSTKTVWEWRAGLLDKRGLWFNLALRAGAPAVFMLVAQSDLGSTMVCLVSIIAVLLLGGLPGRDIAIVCIGLFVLDIVAIVSSLYRIQRFLVMLNPWEDGEDGQGAGFQLIHSLWAVSGGGLFGTGVSGGAERYGWLPIASSDFIFAVWAEEFGFVGAAALIMLYLVLLWIGMIVAVGSSTTMGSMVAGGMATGLVFQAFLNIASTLGIFPLTGKPLPFISAGGSSLLMSALMVGLIASVARESMVRGDIHKQRRGTLRVVRYAGDASYGSRRGMRRCVSDAICPPRLSASFLDGLSLSEARMQLRSPIS